MSGSVFVLNEVVRTAMRTDVLTIRIAIAGPRRTPLARAVCSCLLADFESAKSYAFHFRNVRYWG